MSSNVCNVCNGGGSNRSSDTASDARSINESMICACCKGSGRVLVPMTCPDCHGQGVAIDILGSLFGRFTWDFGQLFFIETEVGNFVWSDPGYGGDNTIRCVKDSDNIAEFFGNAFVKYRGRHRIIDYCGKDVRFVPP